MTVDAIVLAGARNDGPLAEEPVEFEAFIDVAGRPVISYVIDALAESGRIERVALVGPEAVLAPLGESYPSLEFLFPGDAGSLLDNLQRGFAALATSRPVLIVTSDIPLLTPEAIRTFLDACSDREADVHYPIIRKEDSERAYPGVTRTYVRLADGQFTGGNVALLGPDVLARYRDTFDQAIAMRKNPLALARLFGLGLLVKMLMGRLTVRDVEERFEQGFGLTGRAVPCPHPEIGLDVDKPSDLAFVRRLFAERPAVPGAFDRTGPRRIY